MVCERQIHNDNEQRCSPDELAREVWRQISTELGASLGTAGTPGAAATALVLDRHLHRLHGGGREGRDAEAERCAVSHSRSSATGRTARARIRGTRAALTDVGARTGSSAPTRRDSNVWQAGHGGYQIHFDKLVFAGTWCKTFTRITSMEAASRIRAPLGERDHRPLPLTATNGDPRENLPLPWRMPYGFVDQELSSPDPIPDAAPATTASSTTARTGSRATPGRRALLDAEYFAQGHRAPVDTLGPRPGSGHRVRPRDQPSDGRACYDPVWIIEQLRQWRHVVETMFGDAPRRRQAQTADANGRRTTTPSTIDRRMTRGAS